MQALPAEAERPREARRRPRAPRRPACPVHDPSIGAADPCRRRVERRPSIGRRGSRARPRRGSSRARRRGRPPRARAPATRGLRRRSRRRDAGRAAVSTIAITGGPSAPSASTASGVAFGSTSTSRPQLVRELRGRRRTTPCPRRSRGRDEPTDASPRDARTTSRAASFCSADTASSRSATTTSALRRERLRAACARRGRARRGESGAASAAVRALCQTFEGVSNPSRVLDSPESQT